MDSDAAFKRRLGWTLGSVSVLSALAALGVFGFRLVAMILLGILLAILLSAMVDGFSRFTRLSRPWSYAAVLVLSAAAVAASLWFLIPPVVEEVSGVANEFPSYLQEVEQRRQEIPWLNRLPSIQPQWVLDRAGRIADQVVRAASYPIALATSLFIALFVGLYAAAEPQVYVNGFLSLVPPSRRDRVRCILSSLHTSLQRWILGRLIAMLGVGILTLVGLNILDIGAAVPLAVLAGLLDFVPNIGPILASLPAILFGFLESPWHALLVAGLYAGVQMAENLLIGPLVERGFAHLPPVLTISVQLVLGLFSGILGLIVAAPLTIVLLVCVRMLYVEDMLGRTADPRKKPKQR